MRIHRISVQEYLGLKGREYSFELPTAGGLVILEGPNEAGKTTLLRFMQSLLFGNEPAQGALVIEHGAKRYRLEQTGKRSTMRFTSLDEGAVLEKGRLDAMLGGLDGKVYRNIFAFGLSELSELATLTDDDVQERIFSAGVAGAGRNARQAVRQIDGMLNELLRARTNSQIADLSVRLEDAIQHAADARKASDAYGSLRYEEKELLVEIEEEEAKLRKREEELRRYAAMVDIWPLWSERNRALAELDGLEVFEGIPPDAPARAEQALEACRRAWQ